MVEIKAKLKIPRTAYKLEVKGRLRLPFAQRRGGEAPVQLDSGEEVALMLPRGEILRGGDLVTASDGRVIEVVAEPEKLLQVECGSAADLALVAYRLGDRHVAVEFRPEGLRVAADSEVGDALRKMGAQLSEVEAPFEPEAGAYGGGHQHDETVHGGKIHDHGHDHDHDHHHDHDHKHHKH